MNLQTPVQAGDAIQFQVNRYLDNGCDHTDWNMSVRYFAYPGEQGQWPLDIYNVSTTPG